MILTGNAIAENLAQGMIRINPFFKSHITTNTYDLALGSKLLKYVADEIDPKKETPHEIFNIPPEGYLMKRGEFLLGETHEFLGSNNYVPIIHGKSGTARLGLFVHVTADIIDIGFYGKSTLQLYATLPVRIYTGMPIAQVSFWVPKGIITLYKGKYQNSDGPQPSKIYKDFNQLDTNKVLI